MTVIKLFIIFHEDLFENKVNIQNDFAKSFFNENQIFVNENHFKRSK